MSRLTSHGGLAVAMLGILTAAGCSSNVPYEPEPGNASAAVSSGRSTPGEIRGYGDTCLDVSGGSSDNGAKIQLWRCNGTNAQVGRFDGEALVTPSGKCLDVEGASASNGTRLVLWDCHGGENQKFRRDGDRIVGLGGKCLDASGPSSADGTPIILWDCHGGENQKWRFSGEAATVPASTASPEPRAETGSGAGAVFEGFDDGFGLLGHAWQSGDGVKAYVDSGVVKIDGTRNGAGLMQFPGGRDACFGNGLFEIRSKLKGDDTGDNSGPANVLWPSDDVWPGSEVDIGEIDRSGRVYMATHWKRDDGGDGYRLFYVDDGFDQYQFHTYAAFLQTDKITYLVDGKVIGEDTEHPAPDAAHGGVNHCLGIMNRSSGTGIEADWVRWTPESSVR
jgi:hypothetical protein